MSADQDSILNVLRRNPLAFTMADVNSNPHTAEFPVQKSDDHVLGEVPDLIVRIYTYLQSERERFARYKRELRDTPIQDRKALLTSIEEHFERYMFLYRYMRLLLRTELEDKWSGGPDITLRCGNIAVVTQANWETYKTNGTNFHSVIDRDISLGEAQERGLPEFAKFVL